MAGDHLWNLHQQAAQAGEEPPGDGDITVVVDADTGTVATPDGEASERRLADGSVVVQLNARRAQKPGEAAAHDANLAEQLDQAELDRIVTELLEAIEADDSSRSEWLNTRARGIDLLGFKIEDPKGDAGSSGAPVEGMSVVRHPLLAEAVITAQSNARAELLPASGPVKVSNDGDQSSNSEGLADALEKDMNHYLTKKATEYYPDTDRMLLFTVFGGSGFKKVYKCPLRRRPVSESVDAKDLIVSNSATDLKNASRVTHDIKMRPSVMKRMQHVGAYREVDLAQPSPQPSVVDRKEAEIQGVRTEARRPEDEPFTVYECRCELDLDAFAPTGLKGEGLALPYVVTIEKDSRTILALRRNWEEEDEDATAKPCFVQYPYLRGFGFYGIGLLHLLGNTANALTAAEREMLDAGMFANFPGFLIAALTARQKSNEIRVGPGQGVPIETNGKPIGDAAMALPYKDVTPGLLGLYEKIGADARRLGGIAEMKVGEGRQDAPVGTTIALIEQATRIESAVHKNMHQAQSEEFSILADLFREDPESFWRGNKKPATQWDKEKLIDALNTYGLEPQADPNTPSHIHRIMKAVALEQIDQANPGIIDKREKVKRILRVIGWDDIDGLFAPPQAAAGPDPTTVAGLHLSAEKIALDREKLAVTSKDKAADRSSKERIATLNLAHELAVHPTSEGVVENTLARTPTLGQPAPGPQRVI